MLSRGEDDPLFHLISKLDLGKRRVYGVCNPITITIKEAGK